MAENGYNAAQQKLVDSWEAHMKAEFADSNVDETMATMISEQSTTTPFVNHVPVMTGGYGHDGVRNFYTKYFIPQVRPIL